MSGGLGNSVISQSTGEHCKAGLSEPCDRLTFVSHAGENKPFARSLLEAIEAANVATFFDDDMAMGTVAGDEMITRAANADQGVVVLSRPFLTKKWPMMELNLFIKHGIRIHPLYYGIDPDDLKSILGTYDRQAGDDEPAFRRKMNASPVEWQRLMREVVASTRDGGCTSLPDPMCWREDVGKLAKLTGLRRNDFEEDEEDKKYVTAVAKLVTPPGLPALLPPLPEHFVNVQLVNEVILKLLDRTSTEMPGVVLIGMGGSGKSVIASAVVRDKRIRRRFADGVLWLDQDQERGNFSEERFLHELDKLAHQFEEVVLSRRCRQGRVSEYNLGRFKSVSSAQGFFSMWQQKFNLQCLLVVDNTWNVEILQAVRAMGFQTLVTTRKEAAIPASPGWCSKAVLQMDEESAIRVLENCSGATSAVPTGPVLQVAKRCAFLPLALALAGSTVRGVGNPLSSDTWRELHGKLKNKEESINEKEGDMASLNTILAVSIDELGRTRRDRFFMLAVLGKGVLAPTEMLRNLWSEEDVEGARFLVDGLVARCLLQRRVVDLYFVHDLLLDYVKAKIEKSEAIKDAATSRQTQYLGKLDVLSGYSVDRGSLEGFYSLVGLWKSLAELSGNEHLEVEAYKASLEKLGEEKEATDVATICSDLGYLYILQGKFTEAEQLYERSQTIVEKVMGPEHLDVAASLNNLAGLLQRLGKYDETDPLYLRAIEIGEKALGPDHPELATYLNNRALLLEAQGKYDVAGQLLERSQAIREKVLGQEHPDVAHSLNNRVGLLQKQGKYQEAQLLAKRALVISEKVYGPDHPEIATALNNQALLFKAQGQYPEAEPLYERLLTIDETFYGPDNPEIATGLTNWAALLKAQGKYDEAGQLCERSLAIREKALGPVHPDVASSLNNWAVMLQTQGKFAKAGPLFERAARVWENVLGPHHPTVATALSNWAWLLYKQGKCDEADLLLVRAIALGEEAWGPEHPDLAACLNQRAVLLREQENYDKAEPLFVRAIAIGEKALGAEHPNLAGWLTNRAVLLKKQGKYDDADRLCTRAIEVAEKALGPDHPDLAASLNNRAEILQSQGKYSEAEPLYERTQKIFEESHGRDHPNVAAVINNRAWSLCRQGKLIEAEPLFETAAEIWEKTLGLEHPTVATVLNNRALLLAVIQAGEGK